MRAGLTCQSDLQPKQPWTLPVGPGLLYVKIQGVREFTRRVGPLKDHQVGVLLSLASPLTEEQTKVLQMIADGCDNNGIARGLGISWAAAGYRVETAITKLDADNRAEAVAIAMRSGWIS